VCANHRRLTIFHKNSRLHGYGHITPPIPQRRCRQRQPPDDTRTNLNHSSRAFTTNHRHSSSNGETQRFTISRGALSNIRPPHIRTVSRPNLILTLPHGCARVHWETWEISGENFCHAP